MARYVHMAPEAAARRIARSGIAPTRLALRLPGGGDRAVWAFPVLPSYTLTHQWLRELKRRCRSPRTMVAVTFRIPDEQPVLVRYYGEAPRAMSAAAASGLIRARPDPLGWEVMVPRRIAAREIIATPPQRIGWRTTTRRQAFPCGCPVCIPPGPAALGSASCPRRAAHAGAGGRALRRAAGRCAVSAAGSGRRRRR